MPCVAKGAIRHRGAIYIPIRRAMFDLQHNPIMQLVFLKASRGFAFLYGDTIRRIQGEDVLFPDIRTADEVAQRHGLWFDSHWRVRKLRPEVQIVAPGRSKPQKPRAPLPEQRHWDQVQQHAADSVDSDG